MAMVRSTFAGFTTAQLALAAAQRSIDAAGQNISNVNTEGYTRQRIDLASISPTGASYFMMQTDIRVGQGVQMTNIIQIRDPFIDVQYRNQLAKVGTIDARDAVLTDIGEIFDEVDKTAVLAALNDVVSQLNIMANPDSSNQGSSDTLVRSSMEVLLNVIHENATKLADVRADEEAKLKDTDIPNINEYLESIAILNESIKNTQILGGAALELQDQRNQLIDELATYLPIDVTYRDLNLGAGIVVDTMELSFTDTEGEKHVLINDVNYVKEGAFKFVPDDSGKKNQYGISITDVDDGTTAVLQGAAASELLGEGVLKGTLDSLNMSGTLDVPPTDFKGIGFYEKAYNSFVDTFATRLNELNEAAGGGALFATVDGKDGPFTAANIQITDAWMNGTTKIMTVADMEDADTGNLNVLKMINALTTDTHKFYARDAEGNVIYQKQTDAAGNIVYEQAKDPVTGALLFETDAAGNQILDADGNPIPIYDTNSPVYVTDADGNPIPILAFEGNCFDAYSNLQTTQAIDKKAANSVLETRTDVLNNIADSKDSVSGVWMDEEVMDLMQFQQSYNAAAQLMTTLDELLVTLLGIKR